MQFERFLNAFHINCSLRFPFDTHKNTYLTIYPLMRTPNIIAPSGDWIKKFPNISLIVYGVLCIVSHTHKCIGIHKLRFGLYVRFNCWCCYRIRLYKLLTCFTNWLIQKNFILTVLNSFSQPSFQCIGLISIGYQT